MKIYKCLVITCLFFVFSGYAQSPRPKTIRPGSPVMGITGTASDGQLIYKKYCLTCHQADGGGVPRMNPPLIKTSYVLGEKARIIKILLNGFNEQADIDGESYSNVMPSMDFLKDKEIADVLTYVRSNFSNKASAVKVAEVTKLRVKR